MLFSKWGLSQAKLPISLRYQAAEIVRTQYLTPVGHQHTDKTMGAAFTMRYCSSARPS
jgi:hypothetical protein